MYNIIITAHNISARLTNLGGGKTMFGKNKKNAGNKRSSKTTASKNRSAEAGSEVNNSNKASASRKTTKNCSR